MTSSLVFQPYLPWDWLLAGAGLVLAVLLLAAIRGSRGLLWRLAAFALLFAFLTGPRQMSEMREKQSDIVLAVVDESDSQQMVAGRLDGNEAAVADLTEGLEHEPGVELRVVRTGGGQGDNSGNDRDDDGTPLFDKAARLLATVPMERLGAVVMVTDGQVHDQPDDFLARIGKAPLHVMLTGKANERDRRMVIDKVPGFGLVGSKVQLKYRIEDQGMAASAMIDKLVDMIVRIDGEEKGRFKVPVGKTQKLDVAIDHAGETIVELEAAPVEGELTDLNNRQVIGINGVRDRLRVLLVSGQPHVGERAWRNLLKSDPAVDLVHFTILRPPEKSNPTPRKELSLIVFPVEELFVKRLHDFDLIIFDRYLVRHVLAPPIFTAISNYVSEGGAIMVSAGPEYAGPRSLFQTGLGPLLPVQPSGLVIERAFRPALSDDGKRHPVTAGLVKDGTSQKWGRWYRQIEGFATAGETLMTGPKETPLLVLKRVDKGRVALLMSDQVWLWARGFDGGGPQAELMRRIAHWLMREPELEEEALQAKVQGGMLMVTRRSLKPDPVALLVTRPDGQSSQHPVTPDKKGLASLQVSAKKPGLYRVFDGSKTALAAAGKLNRKEYADLRSTDAILGPVAARTGGGVFRMDQRLPNIRSVKAGWDSAGSGWLGVRRNGGYRVTGLYEKPLVPGWLFLLAGGMLMAASWWREGR